MRPDVVTWSETALLFVVDKYVVMFNAVDDQIFLVLCSFTCDWAAEHAGMS